MRMTDIISKKRYCKELSDKEIAYFVNGVVDGSIPDYQTSALLMAICINGLNERETLTLTLEMAKSGDMADLSPLGDKTVDKHSTGGVGDKTTLAVAPIAAALGCTVAKMSGRGLGFTGGTVDKLESIDGYRTSVTAEEFLKNASLNGLCLAGQSGNLVPADKKIYALRDVTATVESIPLIAASIMSKKLASGAKNIVLDVKCGSGAFMKTPEDAEILAREMIKIGKNAGRNMAALITDMDTPLGYNIGNSLEVEEAVEVLKGGGPEDLKEICFKLSEFMTALCFGKYPSAYESEVKRVIKDGSALKRLCDAVKSQGGNADLVTGKAQFKKAQTAVPIYSENSGFITSMNCETVGISAQLSGAGRETKDDVIDSSAGIVLNKKYGDSVKKGELLATVYGAEKRAAEASEMLRTAYSFGNEKPEKRPVIYKAIY